MPFQSVTLKPGVIIQQTPTLNQTSWSDCNLVRFQDGLPQKYGGWTKFINATLMTPVRALLAWQDLNLDDHVAAGADGGLYVITDGLSTSITPQERSQDAAPDFTTAVGDGDITVGAVGSTLSIYTVVDVVTPVSVGGVVVTGPYPIASVLSNDEFVLATGLSPTAVETNAGTVPEFDVTSGDSIVVVTLPDHGYSVGSAVEFRLSTTVGGITISGYYSVIAVPTADTFTINGSNAATSTTSAFMNGGDVHFEYYIAIGPNEAGIGWGAGPWGSGAWGYGSAPDFTGGTDIVSTNWTLDNWGEILLACSTGKRIYYWQPNSGFTTASVMPNAPYKNTGIFVAMPAQILVAYGTVGFSNVYNPLLVRWSDVSDFSNWTPSSITQAGSFVIPEGNEIVGALQIGQRALIFTDVSVWDMSYIGVPDVFGFNRIASQCGLIGIHAFCRSNASVFWMSGGNFYVFDSQGVRSLDCPVWDYVFQNLDTDNQWKTVAASNTGFDEVAFFFPSLDGGGEIDRYVKLNTADGSWDYGILQRTAWIDQGIYDNPLGADASGQIYRHEDGNDADTVAMDSYIVSGWWLISEGDPLGFVDLLMPDFKYGQYSEAKNAQLDVTLYSADWPASTPRTHGPYAMTESSTFINTRARGRQMMMRIESNQLGSFWRLGNFRYRGATAGRR